MLEEQQRHDKWLVGVVEGEKAFCVGLLLLTVQINSTEER